MEQVNFSNVSTILSQYRVAIDDNMAATIERHVNDVWVRNALAYHLGWLDEKFQPNANREQAAGKKIRPTLALLCFQSALQNEQQLSTIDANFDLALTLGASLELLHNYSLIHDDIEDEDKLRRGRTTLWAAFGSAKAINVGDCLHALAFCTLSQLQECGLDSARVNSLLTTLMRCSVKLTLGQQADLSFEDQLTVTSDDYLKMIAAKTAALIKASTYCGALLALGSSHQNEHKLALYAEFGQHLGMAFQLWDDLLGIWGQTKKTGKLSGSDIRRRKKSLPIIYTFDQTAPLTRTALVRLYQDSAPISPEQEHFIRTALNECGAREYVYAQTESYKQCALSALDELARSAELPEENIYLSQLRKVTLYMTERNH
ncbi:MAG: polyprenyl synthetase family protein [Chloroflexota bacterium]